MMAHLIDKSTSLSSVSLINEHRRPILTLFGDGNSALERIARLDSGRHTFTTADGRECYLHSELAPALTCHDGTSVWFNFGLISREDGPAATGPCSITEGDTYFLNGVCLTEQEHFQCMNFEIRPKYLDDMSGYAFVLREDNSTIHNPFGPAIQYFDGRTEYYYEGKRIRLRSDNNGLLGSVALTAAVTLVGFAGLRRLKNRVSAEPTMRIGTATRN